MEFSIAQAFLNPRKVIAKGANTSSDPSNLRQIGQRDASIDSQERLLPCFLQHTLLSLVPSTVRECFSFIPKNLYLKVSRL